MLTCTEGIVYAIAESMFNSYWLFSPKILSRLCFGETFTTHNFLIFPVLLNFFQNKVIISDIFKFVCESCQLDIYDLS